MAHALTHLTVPAVLSTLYTAWLASLVGYGIWNTLLARHPAAAVVPFTMLVPVVGLTTAWLVQGEAPNVWEAAGGALLLLGVADHDRGAGPPATSAGPSAGTVRLPAASVVPRAGWPSADTRSMIRGSCSPTRRHLLLELSHGGHALGERHPDRAGVRGHRRLGVARRAAPGPAARASSTSAP